MKTDPKRLLGERIRVRFSEHGPFVEGRVIVYLDGPCFEIEQDDGQRRAVQVDSYIEQATTIWSQA